VLCVLLQTKQPQHAKKPSIVSERGSDLERPSTDDLAREVYNYTGETGTYRYMAPEVFRHEPYNAKVSGEHQSRHERYLRGVSESFCRTMSGSQQLVWHQVSYKTSSYYAPIPHGCPC